MLTFVSVIPSVFNALASSELYTKKLAAKLTTKIRRDATKRILAPWRIAQR